MEVVICCSTRFGTKKSLGFGPANVTGYFYDGFVAIRTFELDALFSGFVLANRITEKGFSSWIIVLSTTGKTFITIGASELVYSNHINRFNWIVNNPFRIWF